MKHISILAVMIMVFSLLAVPSCVQGSQDSLEKDKEMTVTAIIDDLNVSTGYRGHEGGYAAITVLKIRATKDSKPEKWVIRGAPFNTRIVLGEKYQIKTRTWDYLGRPVTYITSIVSCQ